MGSGLANDRGQMTDDRGQRTDVGGRMSDVGVRGTGLSQSSQSTQRVIWLCPALRRCSGHAGGWQRLTKQGDGRGQKTDGRGSGLGLGVNPR